MNFLTQLFICFIFSIAALSANAYQGDTEHTSTSDTSTEAKICNDCDTHKSRVGLFGGSGTPDPADRYLKVAEGGKKGGDRKKTTEGN